MTVQKHVDNLLKLCRQYNSIFKLLQTKTKTKAKTFEPRIVFSARTSVKNNAKMKTFYSIKINNNSQQISSPTDLQYRKC